MTAESEPKILILGSGPTATFITQAYKDFFQSTRNLVVYTNRVAGKVPPGAFYFHWVPSSVKEQVKEHIIYYNYVGDAETYLTKQWGSHEGMDTSFGRYERECKGYDPVQCIPVMVGKPSTIVGNFDFSTLETLSAECDHIFMTFPDPIARGILREFQVRVPVLIAPESIKGSYNLIIYNGAFGKMVRFSRLFGQIYIEYTSDYAIDMRLVGDNTVSFYYDIHPSAPPYDQRHLPKNVTPVGRYAEVNRSRLAHEAYAVATKVFEELVK